MSKRTIIAVATGVIAGATVVGVPAFAYADAASGAEADSRMESVMDDPAFFDRMKDFMSEMMSDPQMQEQMREHMGTMMEDMPPMEGMEGMHGRMGGGMGSGAPDDAGDSATP